MCFENACKIAAAVAVVAVAAVLLLLLFGVYSCAKQRSVASVKAKSETPYTQCDGVRRGLELAVNSFGYSVVACSNNNTLPNSIAYSLFAALSLCVTRSLC